MSMELRALLLLLPTLFSVNVWILLSIVFWLTVEFYLDMVFVDNDDSDK